MDECIRPLQMGRLAGTAYLFSMAVFLLGIDISTAAIVEPDTTGSITALPAAPRVSQMVSIRQADAGEETITLSARLSSASLGTIDNVVWQLSTPLGEVVADGTARELVAKVPPGEYIARAHYGLLDVTEPLTVPAKSHLKTSFILDAGALRVLPRVQGAAALDAESRSRIYALDGPFKSRLVTTSTAPAEVLVLPAGRYRIDSRFAAGNAAAVVDVEVKAGIMSAVDIDHAAGFVTLVSSEAGDGQTTWKLERESGETVTESTLAPPQMVLQPGVYTASISTPFTVRRATFEVKVGQGLEISLDP
jgi:hypothetical protein